MIQKVSAMDVRKHFGDLLNDVHYRHNSVLITKAGKPMGALIDVGLFEKIRLMEEEFNRMTEQLMDAYVDVDPSLAELEIEDAIKASKEQ